ncbi:venom serine protease-like [Uranotaenia lowii]|uniref:venom serine protease-like n=1 Tax=Uranotaenia lowii TaxID=190385 RepID=UPI0024791AAB|nr:venom serine protease-like [Uranotaenia lowii]
MQLPDVTVVKLLSTCLLFCHYCLSLVAAQQQQFPGCDYYQDIAAGKSYAIFSPNYGNLYPAGVNCRWMLGTTPGSRIALSCPDVYIPQSTYCYYDKLLVSTGGKSDLSDARAYCGTGTLTSNSTGSAMVISLQAAANSYGGRFYCTATKIDCQCGMKRKKKIVGGMETMANEYPMMAALVDVSNKLGIFCGATIITNYHAMTAAHCLLGHRITDLTLLVGEHDVSSGLDSNYTTLLWISSIKYHEAYDQITGLNDIAIVRTQNVIPFSAGVGPVCLPFKYGPTQGFTGINIEAVGWGSTDFADPKSNVLLKVELPVVDPSLCSATYNNFNSTSQICTLASGKDTCQYDSGGPLLYTDYYNGLVYSVGIVNYGMACATEDPSVSIKVANYMDWIVKNTPEWTYCYQ